MDCHSSRIRSRVCFSKIEEFLIFAELISDFPSKAEELVCEDMFIDEHIFLISTLDPWYVLVAGETWVYYNVPTTPLAHWPFRQ